MDAPSYESYRKAISGLELPLAWVDLDRLDANARAIAGRAGDKTVRLASKSVRSTGILRRILDSDPKFQGLLCYSAAEAVWLADIGFDDLMVAYPTFQADHLAQACARVKAGKRIILMVDSAAHVRQIEAVAASSGVKLPVCIDLDLSLRVPGLHFGVLRSPVDSVETALRLHAEIKAAPHLQLVGLMGYEAQVAGIGDRTPGMGLKNPIVRMLKRKSIRVVAQRRQAVVEALVRDGAVLQLVNGGGVGSMEFTRKESVVTEIAAGSGFFQSHLFDHYDNFRHLPAAGFALEVVRQPAEGVHTCFGGGYIASGAVSQVKVPLPYLPAGAKLHPNEGAGEVQTPVLYQGVENLSIGMPVFFRHSKAGELCERFDALQLIQGGKHVGAVKTYRGEGKNFG